MWGYNTNMGQFGGPMTPRMNMGGGPRGFNPWMQGIPNGFTPPNFANNMGEVFGGMPGGQGSSDAYSQPYVIPYRSSGPGGMGSSNTGQYTIGGPYPLGHFGQTEGGPMQFNMGAQPGKMPGNPMPNMPQRPFGFGGGGGNQPRPMEIPPQIAQQLFGYQKPVNDIYQESPGKSTRSKGDNGWLNNMMNENPYLRPMRVGNSGIGGMPMGGFNPRMMGGGMGMGSSPLFPQQQFDPRLLAMPTLKGQDVWNSGGMNSPQMSTQQAAELYFRNMFGGGMR